MTQLACHKIMSPPNQWALSISSSEITVLVQMGFSSLVLNAIIRTAQSLVVSLGEKNRVVAAICTYPDTNHHPFPIMTRSHITNAEQTFLSRYQISSPKCKNHTIEATTPYADDLHVSDLDVGSTYIYLVRAGAIFKYMAPLNEQTQSLQVSRPSSYTLEIMWEGEHIV